MKTVKKKGTRKKEAKTEGELIIENKRTPQQICDDIKTFIKKFQNDVNLKKKNYQSYAHKFGKRKAD